MHIISKSRVIHNCSHVKVCFPVGAVAGGGGMRRAPSISCMTQLQAKAAVTDQDLGGHFTRRCPPNPNPDPSPKAPPQHWGQTQHWSADIPCCPVCAPLSSPVGFYQNILHGITAALRFDVAGSAH